MAARIHKIRHDAETRTRIQTSQLINRLTDHVLGKVELVPSQVTAALGLLKKTVPDLSAVEHSGEIAMRPATELSDDELAGIATGGGDAPANTPGDPQIVH